ncbi:MAG: DNA polymerase [Caldivirga sp. MG_3]|uniref:type-4 uracil-DNA glycosylase n=1 Tax=Caldivirga sp. MU80 TaxID=1650354 RepID=UPI000749D980|nr:type-4 uracil-DNA glycosylase [Caldivirga sp. MU80]KUO84746.1 MAG: DNA polymerase [Caldivirga sp. MG_3]NAZ29270.1 uracil-DNA glycosylase [Caldivirga sp.]
MDVQGGESKVGELRRISEEVEACSKCPLHLTRKRAVPGEGNPNAEVMLIGEAPGEVEDETGRPFVGAAGKLLNSLLQDIGVDRSSLYITNVVKCRPPNNRDPTDEEINACKPYLIRQIAVVRPRRIVTLGRHSTRVILGLGGLRVSEISRVRGRVFRVTIAGVEVEVYPTYHPAAALYNPSLKGVLKEDLARAIRAGGSGPASILDYLNGG